MTEVALGSLEDGRIGKKTAIYTSVIYVHSTNNPKLYFYFSLLTPLL